MKTALALSSSSSRATALHGSSDAAMPRVTRLGQRKHRLSVPRRTLPTRRATGGGPSNERSKTPWGADAYPAFTNQPSFFDQSHYDLRQFTLPSGRHVSMTVTRTSRHSLSYLPSHLPYFWFESADSLSNLSRDHVEDNLSASREQPETTSKPNWMQRGYKAAPGR